MSEKADNNTSEADSLQDVGSGLWAALQKQRDRVGTLTPGSNAWWVAFCDLRQIEERMDLERRSSTTGEAAQRDDEAKPQ